MAATLNILAAGSLKRAFTPLLAAFSEHSGVAITAGFGPAGLLRERIEAGERCALFASANIEHPQALLASGRACATSTFASNNLSLTVRNNEHTQQGDWLTLLADPTLRLGTSTPGCDPSGDYTWQLFAHIESLRPGLGLQLRQRALQRVGGTPWRYPPVRLPARGSSAKGTRICLLAISTIRGCWKGLAICGWCRSPWRTISAATINWRCSTCRPNR